MSLDLAPTAGVTVVAQLHKIDRAVVFTWPNVLSDLVLLWIDLHECARTYERIECVIVGSDISVKHFLCTGLLNKEKRHLAQPLKHTMDEIRLFRRKLCRQLRGSHNKGF